MPQALTEPTATPALFSVIIPAYNEADVIADCLRAIISTIPDTVAVEIIVVANGCRDDTAEIARNAGTGADVRVIELSEGSKAGALNAGNAAASAIPRLFVDADIRVTFETLAATAAALQQPGVLAASPAAVLDTAASDAAVRAYYRVWARHPVLASGVGGSGVYGLSAEGLAMVGAFPMVIADDGYIRALFRPDQQRRVAHNDAGQAIATVVRPPRRLGELIASEGRWRAGDAQVSALLGAGTHRETTGAGVRALLRSGAAPADLGIYFAIKLFGRARYFLNRLNRRHRDWHRDESSRQPD